MNVFEQVAPSPLYQQVAERIREAIVDGRFGPGDALPGERDLAEAFGVSRASVREALRQLEAQGLVAGGRTAQGRTVALTNAAALTQAFSDSIALQQVGLEDLVELRCAVEGQALRLAAGPGTAATAASLAEAGEVVAQMYRCHHDAEAYDRADVAFHAALVAASGNQAMVAVMQSCRDAQARHLADALAEVEDLPLTLGQLTAEHEAILTAVTEGRAEDAATLVAAHIRGFYAQR